MHRTTSSPRRRRRLAAALATASVAALSAGATAAHADSIVFVKGGDVFRATPDGSRVQQVTSTGGYSSVSQDDAGRMVALHGEKLAHIDRDGTVLADIETPARGSADGQDFEGVFDPQLSPNGEKVSYTYYWRYVTYGGTCQPEYGCSLNRLYHGTAYTDPDRLTAWDEPGFRRQSGWIHGSWVDDEQQLLSDPSMKPNEDLVLTRPGVAEDAPGSFERWAEHTQAEQMEDGEMTRDRQKMAFITGSSQQRVWFYNLRTGYYPDYPSTCTTYELNSPEGGRFSDLSWSPDGSHLAFADGKGISTVAIPAFGTTAGDCGTPTEDTKVVIPGAQSPDWGPADLPADPAPQPGTPQPGTTPGGGGSTPVPGTTPGGPGPQPGTTPGTTPGGGGTRPGTGGGGAGIGSRPGGGSGTGSSASTGAGSATGSGSQAGAGGGAEADGGPAMTVARTRLAAALRSGLRVRVSGAGAGKRTFLARYRGRIVASGRTTIGADGTARVTLRFSTAGRKRLAGRRSAKLLVSGAGTSASVTLKR